MVLKIKEDPLTPRISNLEADALDLLEAPEDMNRTKEDYTIPFYSEIEYTIKTNTSCLNIQILGETVKGKSTVMLALLDYCHKIKKQKLTPDKICTDQIEFIEKTREKDTKTNQFKYNDTILGVDEWNSLSETGYNSHTQTKYLEAFSDMQAQRFLHRLACSPRKLQEANSKIILWVLGKNPERKTTRCWLYYRIDLPDRQQTTLLGSVDIDVSNVLDTKLYKTYRKRKLQKFYLISGLGFIDLRIFLNTEIIVKVQEIVATAAKYKQIKIGTIKTLMRIAKPEYILGILAQDEIAQEIKANLTSIKDEQEWLEALKDKKLTKEEKEEIEQAYQNIKETNQKINNDYKHILKTWEEWKKV